MNPTVKNTLIVIIIVLAGAIVFFLSGSNKVPALDFIDIDGQNHNLSEFIGKPLLVVFWATDCPSCIEEMPELIALHHEHRITSGLQILAIAMAHDSPDQIQAMRIRKQIPYLISWDKTGELSKAFGNVLVTPSHFLFSPDGEIVMRKIGALNSTQLKQKLLNMS